MWRETHYLDTSEAESNVSRSVSAAVVDQYYRVNRNRLVYDADEGIPDARLFVSRNDNASDFGTHIN
jgi:hypothetical protein